MSTRDDAISQEALDGVLAHVLSAPSDPGLEPMFGVDRIICRKARISELPAGGSTNVSVYDVTVGRHEALGSLVSARRVGSFVVRLVRRREGDQDVWRIISTSSLDGRVVILTYASEGDRAFDAATRYAADATEHDLASDLHPEAKFFGERRLPRSARG